VHEVGLVHRDIKPENILTAARHSKMGESAFLVDFGLAMRHRSNAAQGTEQGIIGTLDFASVNSLHHLEQSPRDDLEALAYVLIYLVCGSLPWEAIDPVTNFAAFLAMRSSANTRFCPELPVVFLDFLKQARQLAFNERPHHDSYAATFAAELTRMQQPPPQQQDFTEAAKPPANTIAEAHASKVEYPRNCHNGEVRIRSAIAYVFVHLWSTDPTGNSTTWKTNSCSG
jgi:serine/threonine protein kinase